MPATPPAQSDIVRCGAAGAEHGAVVGCCYRCGLILCEQHVFHVVASRHFGRVDGVGARPLVCGEHRPWGARKGLPAPPDSHARERDGFRLLRPSTPPPRRRGRE